MAATVTRAIDSFDEQRVFAEFARERLSPSRWSNAAGDVYSSHCHAYHKVLYCLSGTVTFRLDATGESIELRAGDRLDIEPQTMHSAIIGPQGVECLEAPRQ